VAAAEAPAVGDLDGVVVRAAAGRPTSSSTAGGLEVEEGNLDAPWVLEAQPSVDTLQLERNRIGILKGTDLPVKESLHGAWVEVCKGAAAFASSGSPLKPVRIPNVTPPPTTASGVDAAWHRSPVTVTFSASDNPGGSSVARTEYKLDSGPWISATSCTVPAPANHSGDGEHTVSYRLMSRCF